MVGAEPVGEPFVRGLAGRGGRLGAFQRQQAGAAARARLQKVLRRKQLWLHRVRMN